MSGSPPHNATSHPSTHPLLTVRCGLTTHLALAPPPGIITALRAFQEELREHKVTIWVRRAGPNYQEGLRIIRDLGREINLPIKVYGPETHVTAIVPLALGKADPKDFPEFDEHSTISTVDKPQASVPNAPGDLASASEAAHPEVVLAHQHSIVNFTPETRCIVYGLQNRAVQGMLDFDFMCKRKKPSVAAMIFPFSGNHYLKFYWGTEETLIPVYQVSSEKHDHNA